jgi:hypothetical protein
MSAPADRPPPRDPIERLLRAGYVLAIDVRGPGTPSREEIEDVRRVLIAAYRRYRDEATRAPAPGPPAAPLAPCVRCRSETAWARRGEPMHVWCAPEGEA